MKNIRVILADDHAMVREGLAQLLDESEGMRVVGQASDGGEALALIKDLKPDIVVLDYTMPDMDAPTLTEEIGKRFPLVKVVILTMHENVHYAVKALEAGAQGYVLKSSAARELVQGLRTAQQGKVYISEPILDKLTLNMVGTRKQKSGLGSLARREFELLRLMASGLKLQDCAKRMHVSQSTASTHRARLMQKLKLNSSAEIIRYALENGITG
jgi:DNA-binding NarL/FixJ family response regulator